MSQSGKKHASGAPVRDDGGALAVLGSGTIACGLAACAAAQGIAVTLWARSAESAERARDRLESERARLEGTPAGAAEVTTSLSEVAGAAVAIEAVIEQELVKRELLQAVGEVLEPTSLLATTTSSLSVSGLAEASARPSRFFGLHVFNPVQRMELVELCFPPGADEQTRETAFALCHAIGKRAIEVPDEPGFVVNRLLFPFLFDAVRLLERTGMDPAEIDACMKLGASHPMGPLELLDLVGIDVAEAIGEALHADTGDAAHFPPGRIKELVNEGKLGRKSGAGFYEYP